jgi:ferredoxin
MTVRVRVRERRCEGHGLCHAAAPDVFDLDDESVVVVRVDPIPAELETTTRTAVDLCPVAALALASA